MPLEETLRSNCPRDCYDGCGLLIRKRDGEIITVRGDPEHPISRGSLCGKCSIGYNGAWRDPARRLLHPLRRIGQKGRGEFVQVSWDEALDEISQRWKTIAHEAGAESILHTHYSGTISMLAYVFPSRFFARLGATEVEPDTICNLAGHVAWGLMFGTSVVGFDPRTARDASCLLIWGANPSHTAPHMDKHWIAEFGGSTVVVDPLRTGTAERATLHLQPRPGTDAALAFSLLHVLRRNGAFDEDFIARYVEGAEELDAELSASDPDWGEAATGVPANDIERAAALYGEGPALLWAGQGLQRQARGGNVMRAVGMLPALTGNVGKAGTGFYYLNSTPSIGGVDFGKLAGAELAKDAPAAISHMGLADQLLRKDRYRAFVSWNTNPVASAADQQKLRAALSREDLFSVVIDCFPTDTADYADFVLPAASFLEFDDLTYSYMNLIVGAQVEAQEPLGESLSNMEIFRRLASAMDFEEPELQESDASLIDGLLGELNLGLSFEELKARGCVPLSDEPMVLHSDRKFRTRSGRIEIASERAVAMGQPRLPSRESDSAPAPGKFRLLSPASEWRLNDSFANDPGAAAQAEREPGLVMHPEDADRLGLSDGDSVRVSNETGSATWVMRRQTLATPGVVVVYKGRWPKLETNGANPNVLFAGEASDMGESSTVHGISVTIRPEVAG